MRLILLSTHIMYQPTLFTHKEGVGLLNGEIVHLLGLLYNLNRLHRAVAAIGFANMSALPQIACRNPALFLGVERMLRRSLEPLSVYFEVFYLWIIVYQYRL